MLQHQMDCIEVEITNEGIVFVA